MANGTNGYWFKPKSHGYGATPSTWQGWLATGLFSVVLGIVAVGAFTFTASLIVWSLITLALGLRVSREEELVGLDLGEHGAKAYPDFQGFLTK